ncbi:MAG: PaaI family thioesterase [Dehalococcoidia bacterium]
MSDDHIKMLNQALSAMYPKNLGMQITGATPDRITAELTVSEDVCTTDHTLHGGAAMTMADFLGASGTFLNLPPGAGTSTLESKTNFIGSARVGEKVLATCEPVHKGKSTQVWRTTLTKEDGRTIAIVTQTQMVLQGPKSEQQMLADLFAGKSLDEQKALLAQLERAGAGLYQAFASQETDPTRKKALLDAAQRETDNAMVLEEQGGPG